MSSEPGSRRENHRFYELARSGLLPVGRAAAPVFQRRRILNHAELQDAVRSGLDSDTSTERMCSAIDALSHLGFSWAVATCPEWEPGIPSLMDYVSKHAPLDP